MIHISSPGDKSHSQEPRKTPGRMCCDFAKNAKQFAKILRSGQIFTWKT